MHSEFEPRLYSMRQKTYLMVEWVGTELHGAGDDGLCGDRVEDGLGLEDDQAGNVGHDLTFLELLQV